MTAIVHLLMGSTSLSSSSFIAAGLGSSVGVAAYNWNNGFGTKFSNPSGVQPTFRIEYINNESGSKYIALMGPVSPYLEVYQWSTSGFGTKLFISEAIPGSPRDSAFNAASSALAIAHDGWPYLTIYDTSLFGTGSSSIFFFGFPDDLPLEEINAVAFSEDGAYIAVASDSTILTYAFNNWSGITGLIDTLNTTGYISSLSVKDNFIAFTTTDFPSLQVYEWEFGYFGSKISDPSTFPMSGQRVKFTDGAIAHVGINFPRVEVYSWTGGFGTRFSDPNTLPGTGWGVDFINNAIAVSHSDSPHLTVYPWSSSGFGTKFSDPATAVSIFSVDVAYDVAFSNF